MRAAGNATPRRDPARHLRSGPHQARAPSTVASLDHGPSSDFIAHRVLNGADIPGLENLANLERLPPSGAWVIALPMKIEGGTGGPCRIIAVLP